jgi:crossover junction endodeoxyribonuclease RuvC
VTPTVLGIDPGTAVTGYGVVAAAPGGIGHLIECGVIRTAARSALWHRLDDVYCGIAELIQRHQPTVVALESIFYAKNVRTTMTLGHVRGVILLAAARAGLEVSEFPPATVKKAVGGGGGAAKMHVGLMVQRLLRLRAPPTPSDAADAVAVAMTYLLTERRSDGRTGGRAGRSALQPSDCPTVRLSDRQGGTAGGGA